MHYILIFLLKYEFVVYKELKLMLDYNILLDITIDYTNIIINSCMETIIVVICWII